MRRFLIRNTAGIDLAYIAAFRWVFREIPPAPEPSVGDWVCWRTR